MSTQYSTDAAVAALRLYEAAHEDLFAQCCSNPIKNAWGKQVNLAKLNIAHEAASRALSASPAMEAPAASTRCGEHYDELRATLTGLHTLCENISAIERRVGPLGSHARGYTHKITAALRHLDALAATPQAPDAPAVDVLSQAVRDVLSERQRQVEAEGYDTEHDDAHVMGEIGALAALYLMPDGARDWDATSTTYGATLGQALLPENWTMPTMGEDRRGDLVKGIACGLAELERWDRVSAQANGGDAA